jgi:hypothetical protein
MAIPLDKLVGMHANTASPSLRATGSRGEARIAGAIIKGPSKRMDDSPYITLPDEWHVQTLKVTLSG